MNLIKKNDNEKTPICSVNDKTISLPSLYPYLIPNIYASLKLLWYLNCFLAYTCISNTQEQLPFVKISFECHVISLRTSAIKTSLELLGAVQSAFWLLVGIQHRGWEAVLSGNRCDTVTWNGGGPSRCCLSPVCSCALPLWSSQSCFLKDFHRLPTRGTLNPFVCLNTLAFPSLRVGNLRKAQSTQWTTASVFFSLQGSWKTVPKSKTCVTPCCNMLYVIVSKTVYITCVVTGAQVFTGNCKYITYHITFNRS